MNARPAEHAAAVALFNQGLDTAAAFDALRERWPKLGRTSVWRWARAWRAAREAGITPAPAAPPAEDLGPVATIRTAVAVLVDDARRLPWWPLVEAAVGDRRAREVLEGLALGLTDEVAAWCIGVDPATWARWRTAGEARTAPWADFMPLAEQAKAQGVRIIHTAILDGDVSGVTRSKFCAWILERRYADSYRPSVAVKVDAELEALGGMSSEELRAALAACEADDKLLQ